MTLSDLHRQLRGLPWGLLLLCASAILPVGVVVSLRQAAASAEAWPWLLAFVLCSAGFSLAGLGRAMLTRRWAVQMAASARALVLRRTLEDPRRWSRKDAVAAALTDADDLQLGVSAGVSLLRDPLALFGLWATGLWISPWMALGMAGALVPWGLAAAGSGRWLRRQAEQHRNARHRLAHLIHEQTAAASMIAVQGVAEAEIERLQYENQAEADARWRWEVGRLLPGVALEIGGACSVALLGGAWWWYAATPAADRLAVLVCILGAVRPLVSLTEGWSLFQKAHQAWDRLEPWRTAESPESKGTLLSGQGSLSWKHVSVVHGDQRVLSDLNLEVPKGQWCAIVGENGAGKSTLLQVLLGLVTSNGEVWVGNTRIDRYSRQALWANVAWVPQEVVLLGRTVRENLAMGRPLPDTNLQAALGSAGLHLDLDRPLEEYGSTLSGGERQRLAIARALLSDASLWIMDEPTFSMDPAAERAFLMEIAKHRGDRTILMVTHRTLALEYVDRVVTLANGVVVDDRSTR